jgi:hypothetical protein
MDLGMLATAILGLLASSASPWVFGPEPDPIAFREGIDVWRAGKGIDRTYGGERAILSRWFDGRVRRASDLCIWVSPKLVSRRLGYLSVSQRWTMEEVQRRWRLAREELDGHLCFALRLCVLPRRGWDGEETDTGDARALETILWVFTSGPGTVERRPKWGEPPWEPSGLPSYLDTPAAAWPFQTTPQMISPVWMASFREPGLALQVDPLAAGPSWMEAQPLPRSLLGRSHIALYWLRVPVDRLRIHPEGFELRVLVSGRERVGAWRFRDDKAP